MTDHSTDNSANMSTKLEPQEPQHEAGPVTADTTSLVATPSVATPPVVTPTVVDSASDTTTRIATSDVTPPAQGVTRRDTVIDPRVIALRAMFPDYDDIILCVRSTLCPPINPLLTHIAIPGYLCLILLTEIKIVRLMHY